MNIIKLFTDEEITKLKTLFQELKWSDGKGSALGTAKDKKKNLQCYSGAEEFKPIEEIIHQKFKEKLHAVIFPAKVVGLRAALYRAGNGEYDWHVDLAHMGGYRTDISFTIFVSDRNVYEGGELDIESNGLTYTVKGDAGEIVLYSTGDRHRVREVTKGDRAVIVGWVSSLVPNETHRNLLVNLKKYHQILKTSQEMSPAQLKKATDGYNEMYYQIVREFSQK